MVTCYFFLMVYKVLAPPARVSERDHILCSSASQTPCIRARRSSPHSTVCQTLSWRSRGAAERVMEQMIRRQLRAVMQEGPGCLWAQTPSVTDGTRAEDLKGNHVISRSGEAGTKDSFISKNRLTLSSRLTALPYPVPVFEINRNNIISPNQ